MFEVLAFCDRERAEFRSVQINMLTFMVEKVQRNFSACIFFENTRKKKVQLKSRPRPQI